MSPECQLILMRGRAELEQVRRVACWKLDAITVRMRAKLKLPPRPYMDGTVLWIDKRETETKGGERWNAMK